MTTEIILTGTGGAVPFPGRAGPGVMIRRGSTILQFDAGDGTALRLADGRIEVADIDAVVLTAGATHHLVGVPELALARSAAEADSPLRVVCTDADTEETLDTLLDALGHTSLVETELHRPEVESTEIAAVGELTVTATRSRTGDAISCRIVGPDGIVTIHPAVFDSATDASDPTDLLVLVGSSREGAASAAEAGVDLNASMLILTQVDPPTEDAEADQELIEAIRAHGFVGELLVARDLDFVALGGHPQV